MNAAGKIKTYIERVTGLTVKTDSLATELPIPAVCRHTFNTGHIEIDGNPFILLEQKKGIELSGMAIKQRIGALERDIKTPGLLYLASITPALRRTLIANHVNFVVPEKQLNIPSLCMFLSEKSLVQKKQQEIFSPATQAIVLFHLQCQSLDGLFLKDIADATGYTPKTVSVAISELEQVEAIVIEQPDKRSKIVHWKVGGLDLWERLQERLTTPIANVYYLDDESTLKDIDGLRYSYDTALANKTFMSETQTKAYAIEKGNKEVKALIAKGLAHTDETGIRLELWKYPPSLLSKEESIDPLSMALIYRNEGDERIEQELETLISKTLK